jgi:hypothetical protein
MGVQSFSPWRSSQALCGSREFREWNGKIADAKTMLAGITTMVDETKTMVGDALALAKRQKPLAKKQRPWSKTQKHWRRGKDHGRRHETVCGETKAISEAFPTMVGDTKPLAKRQRR